MRIPLSSCAFLLVLAACSKEAPDAERADAPAGASSDAARPPGGFPDEAAARGLDYINRSGEAAKRTILEANGAGVALIDLGDDGDLDLVFAQGLDSLAGLASGPGADLEVFENDGGGRFERRPGPGLAGWWTGLATGDLDNDGDTDLVAGGFGALEVLLQAADGSLVPSGSLMPEGAARIEVGAERSPGQPPLWVTSIALLDADGDGVLDIYVGQYLDLDPVAPTVGRIGEGELSLPCQWKGHEVYCGPRGLNPQPDRILRGAGDGSFEDRTEQWLPGAQPGYTLGVLPLDADGDGDADLAVANDSSANLVLINDGAGVFTDHGYEAGFAFSSDGMPEAGMGLASGDVNRDGLPDLALTNFSDEPTNLYFGAAVGYTNETFRYGLGAETRPLLSWGVHLIDFDGDGWLELFTANGHVYPQADLEHTGTSYVQPDSMWRLGPQARARRVEAQGANSILAAQAGTRGSAVGDIDGDGDDDLVLARIDAQAGLGINDMDAHNHRLVVALSSSDPPGGDGNSRRSPRDGTGARVIVELGKGGEGFALLRERYTTSGYQSASSPRLSFGLGEHARYAALVVQWPSGRVEELPGGPADRVLFIEEGRGLVRTEDFR